MLKLFFLITLGVCLYTDLTRQRIYNTVLGPAALLALLFHLVYGGPVQVWWAIKGLFTGMFLLFLPYCLGWLGAGDVKLLGVVGIYQGASFVGQACLAGVLIGGVWSAILLIKNKRLLPTLSAIGFAILSLMGRLPQGKFFPAINQVSRQDVFPYGVALVLGCLAVLLLR